MFGTKSLFFCCFLVPPLHLRLHKQKYRGYTARCRPTVNHKNSKKYLKKRVESWKKVLWIDVTKNNLPQDPKHTSSSVKHGGGGVMARECLAATGTGTFIFIDDVTADGSCTINSEVDRNI